MELFAAHLYQQVHLAIVTIWTLLVFIKINGYGASKMITRKGNIPFMMIYALLFTIIVGLRQVSFVFGDTINYAEIYSSLQSTGFLINDGGDWLFDRLMLFCSQLMDVNGFFLIVEVVYIVPVVWACIRLTKNNADFVMLFCLGAFSFFSYGVNGIRNGMACSLVILALSFIQGGIKNKLFTLLLCFLAVSFHKSTALPVLCLWAAYLIKNPRGMFYFWALSIFVSLAAGNTVADLFASLGFDDRFDAYVNQDDEDIIAQFTQLGFRWDFLLYSVVPIALGWYIIFKKKIADKAYLTLLGTYIYSNAFWIIVIRSSFSNRFAYLSWFLYPIVLAYPFVKLPVWRNKQGKYAGLFLVGHLAFTLMMFAIGK